MLIKARPQQTHLTLNAFDPEHLIHAFVESLHMFLKHLSLQNTLGLQEMRAASPLVLSILTTVLLQERHLDQIRMLQIRVGAHPHSLPRRVKEIIFCIGVSMAYLGNDFQAQERLGTRPPCPQNEKVPNVRIPRNGLLNSCKL